MKLKLSRRRVEISLALGLICAVFLSVAVFDTACEDLRQSVLRLHIIANSDSAVDQTVKLAVRDRILAETGDIFEKEISFVEAENAAKENLELLSKTANRVLEESGFDYTATAYIGDSFFETREYDDFTLPAGNYRSLIVELGDAKGKNWWCVVYPAVCVPTATEASLADSAKKQSVKIAEQPKKYVMRFKTVEIYEKIKKFILDK